MLIFVFFNVATILVGYFILLLFLRRSWQFFLHISAAWIIGQMIASNLVFAFSYFYPISPELILIISFIMLIFSSLIFFYLFKNSDDSNILEISFENAPSFYLSLFVITIITFICLGNIYNNFPNSLPAISCPFFDEDISFIQSFLYGTNKYRNSFFFFKDPLELNETFSKSPIPLFFPASCSILGISIHDALYYTTFLNILSTTALFYYSASIRNIHGFLYVMITLFQSGLSFFHYFFTSHEKCQSVACDFYHEYGFSVTNPMYQLFSHHLLFSIASTVSFPLCILSLCYANDPDAEFNIHLLGGFLAALIPNFFTSFSVFFIALCRDNTVKGYLPFAISLIPRFIFSHLIIKPIWREFQNDGVHYSQLLIMIENFGLMIYTFINSMRKNKEELNDYLARLSVLLLLVVFRDGNGTFENSLAIHSVFTSFVCLAYCEQLCQHISNSPFKPGLRRGFSYFMWFLSAFVVICGGLICLCNTIDHRHNSIFDKYDEELSQFVDVYISLNATLFSRSKRFLPFSFINGRQAFIGDMGDAWNRGNDKIAEFKSTYYQIDNKEKTVYQIMTQINAAYFVIENDDPWATTTSILNFVLIFHNQKYSIFQIHPSQ